MVKCANCGTGWTSSGLPLCPVCGTKVPSSDPVAPKPVVVEPHPYVQTPIPQEAVRKIGSAVLEVPPEIRRVEAPKPEPYSFPILKPAEPARPVMEPPPPVPKTEIRKPEPQKPEPF